MHSTSELAATSGYSVQQVRDLERAGVIPPAERLKNGYRRFGDSHVTALRAYRRLAEAVGPVDARAVMRATWTLPSDEATAWIIDLHSRFSASRAEVLQALSALDIILSEEASAAAPIPSDSMSISDLSAALGVPSSTLRFWEHEGLIDPDRSPASRVRTYSPRSVADARIIVALRNGGYRIPAVRSVLESIHAHGNATDARAVLHSRLSTLADQSRSLLRAGSDFADLLEQMTPTRP